MKQYKPNLYAQEQRNNGERREGELVKIVVYVIIFAVFLGRGLGIWHGVRWSKRD
jgi:hypothetical protein